MLKRLRSPILILFDFLVITVSIWLAYLLRFDFSIPKHFATTMLYVMLSISIITVLLLNYYKVYKRIWQYFSISDVFSIIKSVVLAVVMFFAIHHIVIFYYFSSMVVPRSIYILSAMIIIIGISSSRLIGRIYKDANVQIDDVHRKALIVGAGSAGVLVVKELKQAKSEYFPVAFIDDDIYKLNKQIYGVSVVGDRFDIPKIVESYKIDDIILALPSVSRSEIAEILSICKQTRCKVKMIPKIKDMINGTVSINMIREISVEDLLGRDPVKADLEEISGYISNQVVLVTGAGGSIGSELCRQIAERNPSQLILLGHGENSIYEIELELQRTHSNLSIVAAIADIQDKKRLDNIFKAYRPSVIFHAAAHKHVPLMENNPVEAIKNNIFGTQNLAYCAHQFKASKFVMISTDKAVNPTNIMGATKRIAELIIQELNERSDTKFSAVRFGNVLGSRGSVIPIFKKQIEHGGPVTVTHPDMIRYFMTIPEAVQLVIQAGALAAGGETFILDMGSPVKISDLAKDLIRLSGLEPDKDVKIVYTGIRPGEKLFEELLTSEEGTKATKHNRIFIGKAAALDTKILEPHLEALYHLSLQELQPSFREIREMLKKIVPTYTWRSKEDEHEYSSEAIKEAFQASLEVVAAINNND